MTTPRSGSEYPYRSPDDVLDDTGTPARSSADPGRSDQPAGHRSGTTTSTRSRSATSPKHRAPPSGWRATSRGGLGGVIAIVAGLLSFIIGLAVIVRASYFVTLPSYAYRASNLHTWGWVLVALGVLLFAVGASYLLGMVWARAAGVGLAALAAIAAFMFLPYAPVFGVIVVALCVFAIWALLDPDSVSDPGPASRVESQANTRQSMRV